MLMLNMDVNGEQTPDPRPRPFGLGCRSGVTHIHSHPQYVYREEPQMAAFFLKIFHRLPNRHQPPATSDVVKGQGCA